jgi:hypothetical protein
MSGAIPHSPYMPSWRGAQLKHRDNFNLTLSGIETLTSSLEVSLYTAWASWSVPVIHIFTHIRNLLRTLCSYCRWMQCPSYTTLAVSFLEQVCHAYLCVWESRWNVVERLYMTPQENAVVPFFVDNRKYREKMNEILNRWTKKRSKIYTSKTIRSKCSQ